jgi:Prenylcysteine lyase
LSPIEWAASAMEMSAISGKNIANLIFNKWMNAEVNVVPRREESSEEL